MDTTTDTIRGYRAKAWHVIAAHPEPGAWTTTCGRTIGPVYGALSTADVDPATCPGCSA